METTTETKTVPAQLPEPPRPRPLTDEEQQAVLAGLGRRKNDPEYLERLAEGMVEARRQINEEYNRYLDEREREAK